MIRETLRWALLAAPLLLGGHAVAGQTVEVAIVKFAFTPAELTIKAGDTVRWVNKEKRQYHSVWFEQQGEPEPPYFFPGESVERTFDTAGEFPYRCGPHPMMRGVIRVE
ncbi:MAG: plastocyanin [Candidatus Sedimenticola endophacoides]|uniref:Plastocyanin n=1 Tax=Candidatus Sedimenticola endophacoides TaxID=2548426 RepID=A0A657PRJ4_9GAMM|nr:MAG: plastocyanin [Candidatus Sedimenticola endophacoides]OQX40465.1 MAG: plastocyanin [Candidatus Sedimenticola endophacoides]OQX40709.1 MAG: plastocyanin [Candidatus Sedimenticola endophacoides]OQX43350.1 MAG: plastocyanin [Candidatus Sedimenticola endophacoides]PUE00685.1 MAG: plastocyanin [Candidatus Sedimenticola endophacoides]